MRLSSLVFQLVTFALAGVVCLMAAGFSVRLIEDRSIVGVREALDAQGLTWADADANGLQVFLIGTAPNEAQRFRALSVAGSVVDAARVLDQMDIAESERLTPPRFSIEILRNDRGVSLIGLVPAATDREALVGQIKSAIGNRGMVSDLLETADYPGPASWDETVRFALKALHELPRSKISVSARRVAITAMAESDTERRKFETTLARGVPNGVRVALDISSPRPVITPFTLRFLIDEAGKARFDACSADTEEARKKILDAARKAGLEGPADCKIGLGVPSRRWSMAVDQSLAALAELGGESVTISDADISLIARQGTPQGRFDEVIGELETALPDVFVLHAVLPEPEDKTNRGPAEFTATLSPEGQVQLRGRIGSETARQTADSFARARFGSSAVYTAARIDEDLPAGWSVRVLAGLESLGWLSNGAVTVTETDFRVAGNTGHPDAKAEIAALLSEKLGSGGQFDIDVTYQEKLDPVASLPSPEECEAAIGALVSQRKINFQPGSETLDSEARSILDDIAEILKSCGDLRLEIAGHTDSQGRETMNQQLSQARAQAVLNELRSRRVLTSAFTAKGYGESKPIADNKTEAGREANRRIEFRLIRPEPIEEVETTLEAVEQSVSEDSQEAGSGQEDDTE